MTVVERRERRRMTWVPRRGGEEIRGIEDEAEEVHAEVRRTTSLVADNWANMAPKKK